MALHVLYISINVKFVCESYGTFLVSTLCGFLTLTSKVMTNASCRCVVRTKFTHTTPILKFLHWLKIIQHIEYKILSLSLHIKFLQLLNLAISEILYLLSRPVLKLVLHLLLPFLDLLHIPL